MAISRPRSRARRSSVSSRLREIGATWTEMSLTNAGGPDSSRHIADGPLTIEPAGETMMKESCIAALANCRSVADADVDADADVCLGRVACKTPRCEVLEFKPPVCEVPACRSSVWHVGAVSPGGTRSSATGCIA
eukprot:3551448-Pleurochrysis_carterae.AAC.3